MHQTPASLISTELRDLCASAAPPPQPFHERDMNGGIPVIFRIGPGLSKASISRARALSLPLSFSFVRRDKLKDKAAAMKIRQNARHRDDRNLGRAEGGGIKVCVCGYVCAEGVRFTDAIEDIQFSARWVHSERGTE